MIQFDASDFASLAVSFDAEKASIGSRVEAVVRAGAARIESGAKTRAPVDTGFLRGSIGYDVTVADTFVEAVIGPTADYAAFVELGTSRMAPQPFMGPSFDAEIDGIRHALEAAAGAA